MENTQIKQIQYPHIVGIDISKMSVDVVVIDTNSIKVNTTLFSNDSEGCLRMKKRYIIASIMYALAFSVFVIV